MVWFARTNVKIIHLENGLDPHPRQNSSGSPLLGVINHAFQTVLPRAYVQYYFGTFPN